MEHDIVIYGAGGHATVVLDALLAAGRRPIGFLDDRVPAQTMILGLPVLGGMGWLERHLHVRVALGIGSNSARRRIAERCLERGLTLASVFHPRAVISELATIDPGTVVMPTAVVNPRARIGMGCIVNSGAIVEHDARLGRFAHAAPNSTLTGAASIGDETELGAGACVLPGVAVGARCTIGAGAVVHRDIPDGWVALGVPARLHRQISDHPR